MTKFRFKIEGWHEFDAEDLAAWATYSDDQKREYLERVNESLIALMLERAIPEDTEYELTVEYEEVSI